MKKKILIVDDSALMRSVICDIINSDKRYKVEDRVTNGLEALKFLKHKEYDAVILDVNMPVMDGIELLKILQKENIPAKVLMASTDTLEGAKVTLEALELGAMDFIHKPSTIAEMRLEDFKAQLLELLSVIVDAKPMQNVEKTTKVVPNVLQPLKEIGEGPKGKKIVAIACSTGGPKALQTIIPLLPKELDAPVVIVQHMPKDFTATLAQRLNSISNLTVTEAQEGDVLEKGHAYIARGGIHMKVVQKGERHVIHYSDEPAREGVKPCANYLYESLSTCNYENILGVVLTGMGLDGTEGIKNLKTCKEVCVYAQSEDTCVVYGMPKGVVKAGVVNKIVPLPQIAQEITFYMGVKKDGC